MDFPENYVANRKIKGTEYLTVTNKDEFKILLPGGWKATSLLDDEFLYTLKLLIMKALIKSPLLKMCCTFLNILNLYKETYPSLCQSTSASRNDKGTHMPLNRQ